MHSLFLKIFLWFWAATAIVIVSLVLVTEMTRTRRDDTPPPFVSGTMTIYSETAAREFNRAGIEGLSKYLREIKEKVQVEAVLFDTDGHELSRFTSENIPDAVKDYVAKNESDKKPILPFSGSIFTARRTILPNNQTLVLFTRFVRSPFVDLSYRSYILRILAVLLTAGLFCYWLAGYISAPVSKIRNAAHELADGNLSVRVSPLIGKRRDELANMARDFDRMAERIESLMTAQWRLLRDISHELRSPLTRLNIGLALAQKRAGKEASGALDRIQQEASLLNEMIDRLLELDRWEFGAETLLHERIVLAQLLEDVVSDADFEARNQNRRVTLTYTEPCSVSGIPTLLKSAIENIVRNAIRHTDEGTTVEIELKCRERRNSEMAVITIRDRGDGISEEAIDDIFQPFYRVDDARDRESGGTGLGLAIAERAVKLHRGTITAVNDVEKGLIVEVCLPFETRRLLQNHP